MGTWIYWEFEGIFPLEDIEGLGKGNFGNGREFSHLGYRGDENRNILGLGKDFSSRRHQGHGNQEFWEFKGIIPAGDTEGMGFFGNGREFFHRRTSNSYWEFHPHLPH